MLDLETFNSTIQELQTTITKLQHVAQQPTSTPLTYRKWQDGSECWYLGDQLHKEDGPAKIERDGTQIYYWHGVIHRTDGPAIIYTNGDEYYLQLGKLHNKNGPAIKNKFGNQWYLEDEQYSQQDFLNKIASTTQLLLPEPSIENNTSIPDTLHPNSWKTNAPKYPASFVSIYQDVAGTKYYYNNLGLIHRDNGAAIETISGSQRWFLNGEEFFRSISPNQFLYIYDKNRGTLKISEIEGYKSNICSKCGGKGYTINYDTFPSNTPCNCQSPVVFPEPPSLIEEDGTKLYYSDGRLHNITGAALVEPSGYQEFYLNGKQYSEKDWKQEIKDHKKNYLN